MTDYGKKWSEHLIVVISQSTTTPGRFCRFVDTVNRFWCYDDPHTLQNSTPPAALRIISCVNRWENKVITLSLPFPSNSYVLQYDGKKWGSLCSKLQLFDWNEWFFSKLNTCVNQMIKLLKSFTVTLLWWIWGALSHHANAAVQKPSPSLQRELFLQHYKERLAVTDWSPYWWVWNLPVVLPWCLVLFVLCKTPGLIW